MTESQFPALETNMRIRNQAFPTWQSAYSSFSRNRADQSARQAYLAAKAADESTSKSIRLAYGMEMLQAILGGWWRETDSRIYFRQTSRSHPINVAGEHRLLDHPIHYRQVGARGRATFNNTAIIAHPYDIWSPQRRDPDDIPEKVRQEARRIADTYEVGIWARPDLSHWFPGWTALLLVARNLLPEDAERWGFIALGDGV
jgi:hypothetical protein